MANTPFKMSGHTLPGPHQKSPAKNKVGDDIKRDLGNKKRKISNTVQDIKGGKKSGTTKNEFFKKEKEKHEAWSREQDKKSEIKIGKRKNERDRKRESSKQRNIKNLQVTKSGGKRPPKGYNRDADAFSPEYLKID